MQEVINKLRERRRDGEEGFTLIELMVVVLIIAILLAIAIPTFLGARSRAQDRAAQSSLRNGLTAAKTIYTDNQSYTAATTTELKNTEPSLTFVDGATGSGDSKTVAIDTSTASQFIGAARSESGKCFYIKDIVSTTGGTTYAKGSGALCKTADTVTYSGSW
jgi:type IV pilus assembly protein PilA